VGQVKHDIASTVIKNKTIIEVFFKIWIKIFGYPQKILHDNSGEFDNAYFWDFRKNLNINIETTASESPWSNGFVERNNYIIGKSVTKVMEDINCLLDIALCMGTLC